MFYVKAWHTEQGWEKWMGPFETAHMAGCVAMGWDQGVTLARVYTEAEAVAERLPNLDVVPKSDRSIIGEWRF